MRILIVGAGVLGSVYAEKLTRSGENVTVLARGKRLEEIKEHGIVLKDFFTGAKHVRHVKAVESADLENDYDLVLVFVQFIQLEGILPILEKITDCQTFLFMGNNPRGAAFLQERLGERRVMLGFAKAAGKKDDYTIVYADHDTDDDESWGIHIGETDGSESARMIEIKHVFEKAGVPVDFNEDIQSYLVCHAALITPMVLALRKFDNDLSALAGDKDMMNTVIDAVKQTVKALTQLGYTILPTKLRLMTVVPNFMIRGQYQDLLENEFAQIGVKAHADAAGDELSAIALELINIVSKSEVDTPALMSLKQYI